MMKSHKDLIVWKKNMVLVKRVYEVTRFFPREELLQWPLLLFHYSFLPLHPEILSFRIL